MFKCNVMQITAAYNMVRVYLVFHYKHPENRNTTWDEIVTKHGQTGLSSTEVTNMVKQVSLYEITNCFG